MRKNNNNLILLSMLFVVALVIFNVVTAKLFYTGISLFGVVITLPGTALCYAITFLATDIIGEICGKRAADRTVIYGLFGQMLATALIVLTQYIPAADPQMQTVYESLLGQNYIFVIGSMAAYLCPQTWDVWIFHKIRRYFWGNPKWRWVWNNASTMTSQIIDTVLFIGISFGIGFGWFFNREMWPTLFTMMIGQYVFKFLLALLDTSFFYLCTRRSREVDYGNTHNETVGH